MDPLNGQQVSDMASLLRVGATVLVINLGGFDRAVEAVRLSYEAIPVSGFYADETLLRTVAHSGLGLVTGACSLSCVWLLAYLVSDISAAILARVTQGLSFTSTSSIVKMVLTFILFSNLLFHPSEVTRLATKATAMLWIPDSPPDSDGGADE
jgi:flagellar biosynthesis protein FliR